jgi:hypothetical protein
MLLDASLIFYDLRFDAFLFVTSKEGVDLARLALPRGVSRESNGVHCGSIVSHCWYTRSQSRQKPETNRLSASSRIIDDR